MRRPEPLASLSETIPDHIWFRLRASAAIAQANKSIIAFGEACVKAANTFSKILTEDSALSYSQKKQGL